MACSTALSSAVTWRPMRSMVACWVGDLAARGIDRDAVVAIVDLEWLVASARTMETPDRIAAIWPGHRGLPAWCYWRDISRRSRHRSARPGNNSCIADGGESSNPRTPIMTNLRFSRIWARRNSRYRPCARGSSVAGCLASSATSVGRCAGASSPVSPSSPRHK